jgi:rhodanese-related sulfurtransferase
MIATVARASKQRTLGKLLKAAEAQITRLPPAEALAATQNDATLIDIRSDIDRERDGIVPGSLHIPRTVLEWRLASDSAWRSPHAPSPEQQVILICDHGCSSVLAAATLVALGFTRASDVIGGFAAWREAALPTVPSPTHQRRPDELAGMRPPDRDQMAF